jgi:replicative DNA helicase
MQSVPFAEEFEKGLIVGILSDPSVLPKVTLILEPRDFYRERNREIYNAILDIDIDNLDSLAVETRLTNNDTKEYFQQLVRDSDAILPGLSNILYYAETIKAKSKLRDGYELGREIAAICYQDNIDAPEALSKLEEKFSRFLRTRVSENSMESTREAFAQFVETLGVRVHDTSGIKTGFRSLDLVLHKLQGLIVLAAKTNVGKTTMAVNIARNVGEHKPVLFFSLEQPRDQIFEKLLSLESGVRHEDIATGAFVGNSKDVAKIEAAKERLVDVFDNIHIDDTSAVNSGYISSVARQKFFEKGEIGLIVVDYLHIMRLNDRNLTEALGDAVKDLRALGRELKCPVILLCQLSRQPSTTTSYGDDDKKVIRRPELSDLRSSGEIEQSADVVIFMHRDSYYDQSGYLPDEDEVEIIVKKNRLGRTGIVTLLWVPPVMRYIDKNYRDFEEVTDGLWQ